jgi:hypothetical protein
MRPASVYFMAQVSSRRPHQAQQDAPPDAAPRTAGRGRHARVPDSRGLPALARRIFAMMNGASQEA